MASLFQGSPQTATSYAQTTSETPKWMQDAIYNQIQWAQNVANRPFEQYQMPTVAELSPLQQQAYSNVQRDIGAWEPAFQQAQQGVFTAAQLPGGAAAATPYFQQGLAAKPLDVAQPYLNAQSSALGGINYAAPAQTLSPYVGQATGMSGVAAAQPYLNQAGATTAQALSDRALAAADPYLKASSATSASKVGEYMSPYQEGVLDVIAKQAGRNLRENILPNVSDAFIRAGQFGSSRMGEFGSRAARDTQQAVLDAQAKALEQGYGQSLAAAQADLARQGQLAGTVGSISGADLSRIMQGGAQYANLGQTAGGLTQAQQNVLLSGGQALSGAQQQGIAQQLQGAAQYGTLGQTAGGLAQAQQLAYLNAANQMGQLTNADLNRQLNAYAQAGQMAQLGQGLRTADIAALETAGLAQQNQRQRELTAAQQQFMQQQYYPMQQLDWLNTQIRGMAPITPQLQTQTGSTTGASYSPSPLSQLATGLYTYQGLNALGKQQ